MLTRALRGFALLLCTGLLTACVVSLHPVHEEGDTILDPALVGTWQAPDDPETWAFSRAGDDAYRLAYTDGDGVITDFLVHMTEIGGVRFLDVSPRDPGDAVPEMLGAHLLPVHTFVRVDAIGETLDLRTLDESWLRELVARSPDIVDHEVVDSRFVFTASTGALRAFVVAHLSVDEAWGNGVAMERVVSDEAAR